MFKPKNYIFIAFFIIANSAFAQIDTITFRFEQDVSTFKIWCRAQKITGTDTVPFELTDTINSAYTFNWGGTNYLGETIEPRADGIPFVIYEFDSPGIDTFKLSVYEDITGVTFFVSKTFSIQDIIRVPNVFTPNNDTKNDLFIVRANGITPLEISIYSRTGTMVYHAKAPIIVWDGRNSSGSVMSEGVYYYILTSDDPNIKAQKGFIHLFDPQK